jgi:hypothetical protein
MPIANIGAVPDVVTNTLIASDWGNAIGAASRGRVVHRFNTLAERDASITAPITGMLCYVLATDLFYGYRTATGWTVVVGGPRDIMHAKVYRAAAWTIPAGFTNVPFDTVARDPMGLWVPANTGFVVQATGVHLFSGVLTGPGGAGAFLAAQWVRAGQPFASGSIHGSMGYGLGLPLSAPVMCSAGDVVVMQAWAVPAGAVGVGIAATWATVDFLGTG